VRIVLDLGLILLLVAVSIGMTAVEAAFYLLKRRRLGHVAVANPRAELANRYLDDPPSLLMPVQIATYTAHVGMTVLVTSLLLDWLGHGAILVALAAMGIYLFVFRLTVPYALVRRNPERALLVLLPVLHPYAQAMAPIVSYLRRRAALGGGPQQAPAQARADGEPSAEGGGVATREGVEQRLVVAVERFASLVVRNIMTPRPDIVAVPATMSVAEVKKVIGETKYSRMPVYSDNLDDIIGMVSVRDLVECEKGLEEPVRSITRPAHLVPETKRVAELLTELQAQRATVAVVIDEYGGTAGLVSIEDIVEELVGEIKDEYDSEAEPIVREDDGAFIVQARVNVDRVEEALGASLSVEQGVGTVGGLVAKAFGRIPKPGERTEHAGFTVEVLDADRKRVKRVRFRRIPAAAEAAE
jgi:putative hemolysin